MCGIAAGSGGLQWDVGACGGLRASEGVPGPLEPMDGMWGPQGGYRVFRAWDCGQPWSLLRRDHFIVVWYRVKLVECRRDTADMERSDRGFEWCRSDGRLQEKVCRIAAVRGWRETVQAARKGLVLVWFGGLETVGDIAVSGAAPSPVLETGFRCQKGAKKLAHKKPNKRPVFKKLVHKKPIKSPK